MKRTSSVKDCLQPLNLHGFIESAFFGNILDNNEVKL